MKGHGFRKRGLLLTLLPLCLFLTACTGENTNPPSETKKEPASAQIPDAYYTSCVNCHGDNLQGGYGRHWRRRAANTPKRVGIHY